jgi:hypothetical protein
MPTDAEVERILCDWAAKERGVDAIFVHGFPRKKRPFYTYPVDSSLTMGFDCLYIKPVADLDDHHGKHPIADLINNPVFPDPYSIQTLFICELLDTRRTGNRAEEFDALEKTNLNSPIEFLELALGQRSELNPVLHRLS